MSSKVKREFLIVAKGDENWRRAVSEQELKRRNVSPEDAQFAPQLLQGAKLLSAYDKFNLVAIAVGKSTGVKADLTEAVANEVVARPAELARLVKSLTEAETEYRSRYLDLDIQEQLFDKHGEDYRRLTEDLTYLRSLPDSAFARGTQLPTLLSNVKAGDDLSAIVQDTSKTADEQKQAVIAVLGALDGRSLQKWATSYGFHYGDRFNEWDGPTREEAKVYFDIAKSTMKHWDEVGAPEKGDKPYDAFAAGQNGSRFVYVTKEYAQKLKP